MSKNDPNFREISEALFQRQPLPPLCPKHPWREDLRSRIDSLSVSNLLKGALHLLNDDLESAHRIAMACETMHANYLHALVHRREGDFSNSRYWFNTLREHPAWRELRRVRPDWSPLKFLAWCESCSEGCPEQSCQKLEELQAEEMRVFLRTLESIAP